MADETIRVIADKEDIVAIADKVRTLDNTTSEYELGELVTSIDAANVDLDSQSALIAQIQSALEGKASGGGSGGNIETEFVTLTFNDSLDTWGGMTFCCYDEENQNWDLVFYTFNSDKTTYKLRKNSHLYISNDLWHFSPSDAIINTGLYTYQITADATASFD